MNNCNEILDAENERDAGKPVGCDKRCIVCGINTVGIVHIINRRPEMASWTYLLVKHDREEKEVVQ